MSRTKGSPGLKCESCRRAQESLYLRHADGRWVCPECVPASQAAQYPRLRELIGARGPRVARRTRGEKGL
jgi:hypothetical protein